MNPRKACTFSSFQDRRNQPLCHPSADQFRGVTKMVEPVGLEPTLPPCKGGVLPLNYGPVKIMVGAAGIEPATACSQSRRAASALRSDAVTLPCSGLLCSTLPRRCVPHISEHCSTLLCLANLCPAKYQRPPARCRRPSDRGTSESLPEILGRDPDDHGPGHDESKNSHVPIDHRHVAAPVPATTGGYFQNGKHRVLWSLPVRGEVSASIPAAHRCAAV